MLDIGNALLWVEEAGAGRPVVCVSGFDGRAAFWRPYVAPLAAFAHVVTFDQRGVGRSSPSAIRYSTSQMAEDLLSVLDALGFETATLVGHGPGSTVALQLAIAHPGRVERLVLGAPWPEPTESMNVAMEVTQVLLQRCPVEHFLRFDLLRSAPPGWWDARPGLMAECLVERREAVITPELEISRLRAAAGFAARSWLANVRIPTLVIAAVDDQVVPFEASRQVAESLPNAHFERLEQGGHLFMRHRVRDVQPLLSSFLGAAVGP
jgi:aminoacrylate hydrolase